MQKLKQFFYRWLARRRLTNRYLYLNEVNILLEKYLEEKIVQGGSPEFMAKSRQELSDNQKQTRENSNFISFLKRK